ncbi:MAG: hypothetical protein GMKNLPBB_02155 [Myxococcota bacterium]|nr:hypothetical protein [Myxococcota bacterium]
MALRVGEQPAAEKIRVASAPELPSETATRAEPPPPPVDDGYDKPLSDSQEIHEEWHNRPVTSSYALEYGDHKDNTNRNIMIGVGAALLLFVVILFASRDKKEPPVIQDTTEDMAAPARIENRVETTQAPGPAPAMQVPVETPPSPAMAAAPAEAPVFGEGIDLNKEGAAQPAQTASSGGTPAETPPAVPPAESQPPVAAAPETRPAEKPVEKPAVKPAPSQAKPAEKPVKAAAAPKPEKPKETAAAPVEKPAKATASTAGEPADAPKPKGSAKEMIERGYTFLDGGKHDAAIAEFQAATKKDKTGEALMALAEAYEVKGDKAQARKYASEYLSKYPDGKDAAMAKNKLNTLR